MSKTKALYLAIAIFGVAGPQFSTQQSSIQMTDAVERLGTPDTRIVVFRIYLPGLIYYADRIQPILDFKTPVEIEQLINSKSDFLIVTNRPGLSELQRYLPADAILLETQTRFLKGTELFVVGRRAAVSRVNQRLGVGLGTY